MDKLNEQVSNEQASRGKSKGLTKSAELHEQNSPCFGMHMVHMPIVTTRGDLIIITVSC